MPPRVPPRGMRIRLRHQESPTQELNGKQISNLVAHVNVSYQNFFMDNPNDAAHVLLDSIIPLNQSAIVVAGNKVTIEWLRYMARSFTVPITCTDIATEEKVAIIKFTARICKIAVKKFLVLRMIQVHNS